MDTSDSLSITGLPAFQDNYIWALRRPGNPAVALVDPGAAEPVLDHLRRHGLSPVAILVTHHHRDHVGGIAALVAHFDIPVYGPAREDIPSLTHRLQDGDEVTLPGLEARLQVLEVPGHTAGHVAYYGHGALFCGDTLFTGGCGRLFEGTPEQMQHSLARIRALPDDTLVYCAHEYTLANLAFALIAEPGNPALPERLRETQRLRAAGQPTVPSTLALEKCTNPFLRWDARELVAAAEAFAGRRLRTPEEVFGAVRHWKDTLD